MDAKYIVTAHIHVGKEHWKIPFPINFLLAGLENQLVFYWTAAGDLRRMTSSSRKKFGFSISVEPRDGNLQVTKFGVCIIRDEDIQQLKKPDDYLPGYPIYPKKPDDYLPGYPIYPKKPDDSTNYVINNMFWDTSSFPIDLQWYIDACEIHTDLHSFHSTLNDLTTWIIRFILDNGKQQYSLDGIHRIIKCLIEINQEVLTECKEEQMHTQLLLLVFDYYRISLGTSQLYKDFVSLLKNASDNWLSVKWTLMQMVVRSKAQDYNCGEMLLTQLNDLEAAKSVEFSDNFLMLFADICKQTFTFLSRLNKEIQRNKNVKSLKVLARASSVTIAGVFCVVATYTGDSKLLQEMKDISSYPSWLHVIQRFSRKSYDLLIVSEQHMKLSDDRELGISDFCGTVDLLQELKKKMSGFNPVTNENEEDMMIVFNKFKDKIHKFCVTIENMSSHAHKYSLDITEMGVTFDPYACDNLQAINFGECLIRDKDLLQWKVDEDSLMNAVKLFPDYVKQPDSLEGIRKIFEYLHGINQVLSERMREWSRKQLFLWGGISYRAFNLYGDFVIFLKDISDSWLSVKLALEQILVKSRKDDCPYEEMVQQLNDLGTAEIVRISYHSFLNSFASFCEQTRFSIYNEEIQGKVKVVEEVSSITIAGVFSVLATFMDDSELLQMLKGITLNSKLSDLMQVFARKCGEWFNWEGELMKSNPTGELYVWDFYGNAILHNLRMNLSCDGCFTPEIEEEMVIVIDELEKKINNFSNTIEGMCIHAQKYVIDIKEAGMTFRPFGVGVIAVEDIHLLKQHKDSVREAMSSLYRVTDHSLYACETDIDLHSYHPIIHDHTSSTKELVIDYEKQRDSLNGIVKIIKCLHEINQEALRITRENRTYGGNTFCLTFDDCYYQVSWRTYRFYDDFTEFLNDISDSWLIVKLALEVIIEENRADNYTYEGMIQKLNDLESNTSVTISYNRFVKSFASICKKTIKFTRLFNEKLQSNERILSVKVLAEVSRVTIVGLFSFMATYMGDLELLRLLKDVTSNSKLLHLIQSSTRNGGKWFSESGELMKRSYSGELRVWDFYGNVVVHRLKKKIAISGWVKGEMEEEMKIAIDKLQKNIHYFSKTILDMRYA